MHQVARFSDQLEREVKTYSLREHGPAHALAEHFRLVEFASHDGADQVLVHPALVDLLEKIRRHYGRPVVIHSGYRTPAHNALVGGVPHSRHVVGMAADIHVIGIHPDDVADYAELLKPGGLGRYRGFTHLDVWAQGRRWDYR